MGIVAAITAALEAIAAAARAFPLWLAWRQSETLESLTDELIALEAGSLPAERPRLDRVRVKLANAREQHAAVLAIVSASQSRGQGADNPR